MPSVQSSLPRHLAVPLRAFLAVLVALTTAVAVIAPADQADAAVVRSFGKLFSQQTNGSLAITGNRLMTCGTSAACTSALAGTTSASNNNFSMSFLDADGLAGTTSSSSASVTIPSGARVLYAGLFWGAARTAGTGGVAATGAANQLKFRVPGSTTYTSLTADTIDSSPLSTNDYSAYKNVTSLVQAGGSGAYWGADISAATGEDRYGAWSLVVAIGDPSAPLRDLTVFNGYATLTTNETVTTNISGFLAPPTGAVAAKFGTIVYEGDAGLSGDYLTVGSTRLADAESPSANFFGSRVTASGANLTDRNPASVNNLAADAKVVDAPGVVPNGATSTNVTFSTTGDFYYPAVLTTQIDLYAPAITGSKSVSNLNGNSPAKVGDTLEYTMSFTNSGDDNAINSVVEDALPANTTYVPGSLSVLAGANAGTKTDAAGDDQAEYVAASRQVRYRVGTGATAATGGILARSGTTRVRFQVTVDNAAAGTTLTNSANLLYTAATIGTRYTYQTADVTTPVATLANLSLTKTASPTTVTAGNTITYTLRAANAGPTAAADVVVTDTLPTGATLVSSAPSQGACTPSGQTLTCAVGPVGNGAAATVTVVVRVPAGSTATALTNVAEVTSSTSDPNTTDNRASVTTAVTRSADVAIAKTVSPAAPVPGTAVTYTLTATNNGASTAAGVVVTDSLPTVFSGLAATTTSGTCTVTGNGVSCPVGPLAPGDAATVRITATLDSNYTGGALSNRAQVQSDTADPVTTNNTATAVVTPAAAQADLRVAKETVTSPVVAGAPIQYRVTVTNAGPSVASGVVLNDPLPAASYALVTASSTLGSCTVTGTAVSCPIGTLPSGSSAVVTLNATLLSTVTGSISNTASATTTTADPLPGNNSGTVTDTVTTRADLDVGKSATPNPVVNGQNVTYTITVRNIGPSVSRNVVLTDPVPAPLSYVSSSTTQGTCTQAGGTVSCALGDLALGATATVTVVAAVPSAGGANGVTNTATATSTTTDPVTTNNSASYQLQTGASANIVMDKTATATVTAGQAVAFVLTARNDGPSDAQGVTITDLVPANVTGVVAATSTPGATCAPTGNSVSCTAPTLANGASFVVTVTGTVASTSPDSNLVNTASAAAATPGDPTLSDNSATSTTRVQTRADVSVDKTGPATVTAGNAITWTITAANAGPSVADGVVVQDALPHGVTFVSGTGTGVTCTQQQAALAAPLVNCAVGTLASGASRVITLVGRVDGDTAADTTLTNSATASSTTTDPTPGNNNDTHATTVATSADVSLAKSVTPSPLVAGADATYSLVATNNGPSTAQGVVITDTVPASLTIRSATVAGGSCTVTGQQVACTVASLASGAQSEAQIRLTVASAQTAAVVNNGSVTSTTTDPTPGNNTATTTTPVSRVADLEVIKSVDQKTVVAGTGLTYTLTVVNNGPSVATGAAVTDTLPAGLTFVDSTTTAGTCSATGQSFSCSLGDVAPGTPVTVTITARVDRAFTGTSITNTAAAASTVTDPDDANNTSSVTAAVTTSADLSVAKTASPETLVPGTDVTYTITATNDGPSTAQGVVVSDTVPTGITVTTATWGPAAAPCTVTGQDVVCTLGAVSVGQVSVTITGTVGSQFAGTSVTNATAISSTTDDPDPADNTASVTSAVVGQADLALVKTMSPANPVAGQQVVFTLTATNNGPSAALNPQFIDQLPAGLTNVSVVPPPGATGCDVVPPVDPGTADNPNAPTVVCSGPIFRAGFTVSGTITATVSPGFTGTLTNTGRTSSDTIDPVASNNESTVSGLVRQSADVSITKSMSPSAPVPGQPVTYTLTVRNAGPSTATGVTVADTLPAALTGVTAATTAGSCSLGAGNALTCPVGSLAPAALATVTVTGTLRPDFTGTLSNTATASATTPDPDTTNNSATVTGAAAASADVSVVKTLSPATPVPGQQVTFTLAVRNNGPSTATGVTVADQLNAAVTGASATSTTGSCAVSSGNALSCTLGSLAPTATATVTVTGSLAPGFTGPLSNTASVSSPTPDPTTANNSSTVSGGAAPSADVSVSKAMSPTAPIPGSAVSYTIVVRNAGPSTATDVTVADQLNAAISDVTATVDNGSSCTLFDNNALSCEIGSVPPAGAVTVSVTGTLAPTFTGTLNNTANATSTTPDPNSTNNTATVSGAAAPSADVSVAKSMTPAVPVPGQPVRFTLAVRNAGPSTATGVTLADQLNTALTGASATTTAGTCTISGSNALACSLGSVAPGATTTVTVTATLSPSFVGTLSNTATASSPTPDPAPANNTSTVTGDGAPSADVAVTKTMSPANPVPGQSVSFTLTVTNAGPSTAAAVTVTDQLNPALTGVSATATAGTCSVSGTNTLSCALGAVAPGSTVTVTVGATLASAYTGSLSNTAAVASPTVDPNTSNNSASVNGTVAPVADLVMTKSMSPANPVPGRPVSFTLAVRNAGPSTATGVAVTDQLATALGAASATTTEGTCAIDGDNTLACSVGVLAPGATATITVTSTLAPSFTGTLSNTATTSTATSEPNTTNNSATVSGATAPSADVTIAKSMSPTAPIPGSAISYTLAVSNDGPSTAASVVVTDQLNPAISAVTATVDNGTTCSLSNSNLLTCAVGNLAPSGTVTVSVTGSLAAGFTGTLGNTGRVASPTADPDATNNASTVSGVAAPSADVAVVKTMSPANPVPGQPVTYAIAVRNDGPSTASAVTVADQLAAPLSGATARTTAGACTVTGNALGCELGDLVPGGTATVTVTANLDQAFTGSLSNTATATSATPDPSAANNSSTATGAAAPSANLSITKAITPTRPVPGQQVTYLLTVRNAGPSAAASTTVTDQLDPAFTGATATSTSGTCTVSPANLVTCALGSVPSGGTATITLTATLDAAATGDISNVASVDSPTADPNNGNNSGTATGTTAPSADVSITKTMDPTTPVAGDPVTFTLSVRNAGPSTASAVTVRDQLDAALSGAVTTTTAGSCTVGATGELSCDLGAVASGGTVVVTVTADLDPAYTGTLANTGTVSSQTPDPNPVNNSATATAGSTASSDIAIVKTMSPTTPVPGAPITYSLAVHNDGPSTAGGVVVGDRLNAAIGDVTATADNGTTCTLAGGNALSCPVGAIPPNGDVTVTVTGTLAPDFTGQLTNTATADSPIADPDTSNNSSTVTGVAAPSADVSVTKSLVPAPPVPGEPVTYTITVANAGPSAASAVVMTDQVSPSLSGVVASTTAGSCAVSAQNLLTCAVGTLEPAATAQVTVRGTVAADFTGQLSNTAFVSSPTPDPVGANNQASADADSAPSADLSVVKRANPTVPVPGEAVTFTLAVHNEGPSTAASATATDQLDPALIGATARSTAGSCSVSSTNLVSCALGALAPEADASITVSATLAPDYAGTLSNTGSVSSPTPDPDPTDNASTVTSDAAPTADVSIVKALSPATPVPGQEVTYTLTIASAGPSAATAVTVADQLDPALTGASVTTTAGSCAIDADNLLGCTLGTMNPSDGAATVTVTALLATDFTGALSNTATVASAADDPDGSNNSDTVTAESAPSADLSVTKSLSPAVPVPGRAVTFTIAVDNAGPSRAAAVTVTDQLDPALGDVTATVDNGGTCTVAPDLLLECSLGAVDPTDGVVTVTVTAILAADYTGTLTNTAAVGSPTADPVTDDNTDSVTGDAVPSADVSITKSMTPSAPVPGSRVTYTLTVDNDGPSTATGVTVDDQLDAALSEVTVTTSQGTCDPVGADNALSCAIGAVDPADGPVTISVTATLAPTFTGTLANTATVDATTADPDPTNNSDTVSGDAEPSADVSIVKTVSPQVPVPGLPVTYTLTVDNDGPSTATAVTVRDVLDAALTGATVATSSGTCEPVGADNTVSCSLGALDPAATPVTVTVTAILAPAHRGTLSNTATVESATPDPDSADNTDTVTTPTGPNADLSLVKTVNPQAPVAGGTVTYTLTVHNDGPSTATGVTVRDPLEDALLDPSVTTTDGTCAPIGADGEVSCTIGTLASGQTATVRVTATVAPNATGSLSNTATVSSSLPDLDEDNNTDTVASDVVPDTDLSLVKDVSTSEARVGDDVVFTLRVSNAGPSTARDVVVTDPLPAGLRVAGIPVADTGSCTVAGRAVTCTLDDLAAGRTTEIRVTAIVLASARGDSLTNTASVATSSNDRVETNDQDAAVLAVAAAQQPPAPGTPNPPLPPVVTHPCPSCPGGLAHTGEDLLPQSGLGFGLLLAGLLLTWASRRRGAPARAGAGGWHRPEDARR